MVVRISRHTGQRLTMPQVIVVMSPEEQRTFTKGHIVEKDHYWWRQAKRDEPFYDGHPKEENW